MQKVVNEIYSFLESEVVSLPIAKSVINFIAASRTSSMVSQYVI